MTNLKDIEKRFDERFTFEDSTPMYSADAIKSFYHKEIVQLLEGLKEEERVARQVSGTDGNAVRERMFQEGLALGYNDAVVMKNAEIDKLIEEA